MSSLGFDYTFSNSLMIQVEALYSAFANEMDVNSFLQFYSGNLDVKTLGFTPWSFFANVSYPLTPLLTRRLCHHLVSRMERGIPGTLPGSLTEQQPGPVFDLSVLYCESLIDPSGVETRENNTFGFLTVQMEFLRVDNTLSQA